MPSPPRVATSGTAFPAVPSWLWGYDSLGQVISADSSVNTSDRAYQYDTIGNRIEARDGVTATTATPNFAANALNQYITVPVGTSGSLVPLYDDDGNMTSGPLPVAPTTNSALVWDAENRLISTTVGATTKTTIYDSQSRRIAKANSGAATLYIYDSWNCVAEYTGTTLSKTRLWGTDLSGSMQGAGGVGGLLVEKQGTSLYYSTYDGNGNVSEYLDSTGTVSAHFEYDPFGNTVVNTDTGNLFCYRFSTKPLDFATGLYYYGYRYYDPLTGRWPSRDPIGERDGMNLYGFVGNNATSSLDKLGMLNFSIGETQSNRDLNDGDKPELVPGIPSILGVVLKISGGITLLKYDLSAVCEPCIKNPKKFNLKEYTVKVYIEIRFRQTNWYKSADAEAHAKYSEMQHEQDYKDWANDPKVKDAMQKIETRLLTKQHKTKKECETISKDLFLKNDLLNRLAKDANVATRTKYDKQRPNGNPPLHDYPGPGKWGPGANSR